MLVYPTTEKLKALRLHGMAKSFEEQKDSSDYDDMSFEERLGLLVDREVAGCQLLFPTSDNYNSLCLSLKNSSSLFLFFFAAFFFSFCEYC